MHRSLQSIEASLEKPTDQLDSFIFGDADWFERRVPLDDARVLAFVPDADRADEVNDRQRALIDAVRVMSLGLLEGLAPNVVGSVVKSSLRIAP